MSRTAMLVVDVQRDFFEADPPVLDGEQVLARIVDAIRRARAAGLPIVYLQHDGGPGDPLEGGTAGWQLHPAVAPKPGDAVFAKTMPDSFHETGLQAALDERGVDALIVVGNQTEFCIDTTCRRARSLGYKVTLLGDAHSTWDNQRLSARQIIDHHNLVLGLGFASIEESGNIDFARLP